MKGVNYKILAGGSVTEWKKLVEKNHKILAEAKADASTLIAFTTSGSDTVLVSKDTSKVEEKEVAVKNVPVDSPAAQTLEQLDASAAVLNDQRKQKSTDVKAAKGKGAKEKDPNKAKLGEKRGRKKKEKKEKKEIEEGTTTTVVSPSPKKEKKRKVISEDDPSPSPSQNPPQSSKAATLKLKVKPNFKSNFLRYFLDQI